MMKDAFLQVEDSIKRARRKQLLESVVLAALGVFLGLVLIIKFVHF